MPTISSTVQVTLGEPIIIDAMCDIIIKKLYVFDKSKANLRLAKAANNGLDLLITEQIDEHASRNTSVRFDQNELLQLGQTWVQNTYGGEIRKYDDYVEIHTNIVGGDFQDQGAYYMTIRVMEEPIGSM